MVNVDFKKDKKTISLDSNNVLSTNTVIIATGAQAKWLGLDSERKFNGNHRNSDRNKYRNNSNKYSR